MPRLKMPLWSAVAIPAAAYVIRSMMRGSFRPDLPEDAIVAAILVALLSLAALHRHSLRRVRRHDPR